MQCLVDRLHGVVKKRPALDDVRRGAHAGSAGRVLSPASRPAAGVFSSAVGVTVDRALNHRGHAIGRGETEGILPNGAWPTRRRRPRGKLPKPKWKPRRTPRRRALMTGGARNRKSLGQGNNARQHHQRPYPSRLNECPSAHLLHTYTKKIWSAKTPWSGPPLGGDGPRVATLRGLLGDRFLNILVGPNGQRQGVERDAVGGRDTRIVGVVAFGSGIRA
jgi:hypothetical protein